MIIPENEITRYHQGRRENLLDAYLSVKDWYQIDSNPNKRFFIARPDGLAPQVFDLKDVNAFSAFAGRSGRYRISRGKVKNTDKLLYNVVIMRVIENDIFE